MGAETIRDLEELTAGRRAILRSVVADLERSHQLLAKSDYSSSAAQTFNAAFASAAAVGIRATKAARDLIDIGWEPEAYVLVRVVVDASHGLGFMLSVPASERLAIAEKFEAMIWLRAPELMELIENEPERFPPEKVEMMKTLHQKFGDPKSLDRRQHWSGLDRGTFISKAIAEIERLLGEGAEGLARSIKTREYDQLGSTLVHADAAAQFFMPHTEDGRSVRIQPTPDDPPLFLSSLLEVAAVLLFLVSRRSGFGEDGRRIKAHARDYFFEILELHKRHY